MNKSVKRILCGALSLALCSTFAVESVLRNRSQGAYAEGVTASADVAFTDVTGRYDTTKLREEFFNDSVLKTEETAPVYETRTVMVTLSGKPMVERAGDTPVADYLHTWSGEIAKSDISKEQATFLQALSEKGISYKLGRSYNTVMNGVAIEINTKHVKTIKAMKGVESVVLSRTYAEPKTVDTSSSDVVINETDVYETGIYDSSAFAAEYGEGTVVAVLDTGLDYTHNAFQGFKSENVDYAWSREFVKNAIETKELASEARSGSLEVSDVFMNEKVPYAYDYADDDPDVYPSYSNHGTHVAGIIGGYDPSGYTDKDGNPITDKEFLGVVPDAQLVICKVFTDDLDDPDLGGAVSEDIVAALEDCVKLGVDVINMSLGSSCGFTTTDDGDDEGEMLNRVYNSIKEVGISLICAASNDYSAGYGGVYGTNLASNPDSGTVGSPSTFAAALSVASINGQKASYLLANEGENQAYVFFEEARDINSNPFDFVEGLKTLYPEKNGQFEYVVVPGVGHAADYTSRIKGLFKDSNGHSTGRIALVKRGDTTFQEKVEIAMEMGAAGVIIYNNVAGVIRMNLGEIDNPVPSISISMNAGNAMVAGAKNSLGTFAIDDSYAAGPFMSEFSSWGPTHDLQLKPEITAHGGEITSAVPGGYNEQSGTSMATPNMAGFMAIVRSYIKKDLGITDPVEINRLAMQLTMSTAGTVYDQDGLPYSPRKQGAGVAKLENVVGGSKAYLWTDNAKIDYRPKVELGDDADRNGVYTLEFKITNFGDSELSFKPAHEFMTETLSSDKLTVSEQAHMLEKSTAEWEVDGKTIDESDVVKVAAGATRSFTVVLTLDEEDRAYIENSFENGMYVEGFLKLKSATANQCDLALPFMGFYGNWEDAPMLDYSAYEVAENAQDASVLEEDKIKASVWATQPYNIYYNDKYVLPMGGYLYLLPEDADPMYVNEEYNAVSRYNEYYGEGDVNNYMTSTGIKAVYAGLLRNAREVRYKMYDEATGEVILSDTLNRVAKAYSGGGSAVPANVKLEFTPDEYNLIANGTYRMEFEFFTDHPEEGEVAREENTFEFSFTVDYEAPMMEAARVRYYNYKDGNKEKQRIYLDVDVYDNHYAQTMMLCYPKSDDEGDVRLQILTEYPTPIRNPKKNGVTTVTVEITDIYEKYGKDLYVQLDDYALNTCLYQIDINKANGDMLPDGFDLAAGEESISLNIYETHKTALVYGAEYNGNGDASNFQWTSSNPKVADVKNGEIVGLSAGTAKIFVSNRKGASKTITVTVTDTVSDKLPNIPTISFGIIQTNTESLQKADGIVKVNAGMDIKMSIEKDPWYHPMDADRLRIAWASSNEAVATVDNNGNVKTLKKGTAIISATVQQLSNGVWKDTLYAATSIMQVQNEFTVSNFTLTDYNGVGGVVEIPTDLNVMYIGAEAFKENKNITKIIIPETVVEIRERAFVDCTALEEVYFVSMTERAEDEPARADVSMIYEQAFYGCTNLKKIDFSHVKTVTIAADCFAGCAALTEVVDMPSIGTMHHRAFAGTGLKTVDISGLHMSGSNVFANCTSLTSVKTDRFTAIGEYMFSGCTSLRNEVVIRTPKLGKGAFSGCVNLSGVRFESPANSAIEFEIGERAFENCGKNARGAFYVDFGTEVIRSIGARAFAGSSLKSLGEIQGLEILGENAFANTQLTAITLTDGMNFDSIRLTGIPFGGLTVSVAAGSTKYAEENGVIYTADKTKLLHVNPSVTELSVPTGVKTIGDYAFAGSNVTSVRLSDSVEGIGVGAFKNSKLSSFDFGGSAVTEILASAFENSALPSLTLPTSVTKLGDRAFAGSAIAVFAGDGLLELGNSVFAGCTALHTVTLPDGAKKMGDLVFENCTSLTAITLPSLEELGRMTFRGATSLKSVTFGDGALTAGSYTFMRSSVETVDLGDSLPAIGEGLFYGCTSLKEITLPSTVVRVEANAFNGCTSLTKVNGIDGVEYFGVSAFYGTALTELRLTAAKHIGYMAFATDADKTATYTVLELPVAEIIEDYAFFNGGESELTIPASLHTLGAAAFASTDKLSAVTVEVGNKSFFAEDGVLYRHAGEEQYELVYYPTARVAAGEKGERSYAVKEGTARIFAYAFYSLNKDAVNAVVLPYSINAIGESAFFESGILEYTFESIKAPVLETIYRAEVREVIKQQSTIAEYKGYYNTNFNDYLFYYTKYGGQVSPMTMRYPSNGSGYDNPIYTMYFGTRIASENDLMEDATRECIETVKAMPTVEEVKAWGALEKTEENKAKIVAFAETMKTARIYYNNAKANEGQTVFITEEIENKLLGVEEALRGVKKYFEIPLVIDELRVAEDSTHKSEYLTGEFFDTTGLSIIIVYDDYSTESLDVSKMQLVTSGKLSKYNRYVELKYEGVKVRVPVTVSEPSDPSDSSDSSVDSDETSDSSGSSVESSGSEGGGCKSVVSGATLVGLLLTVAGVAVVRRKEN